MQTRIRTTIVLLTITGVTGIWLVIAPFLNRYQAIGEPWITATTHHVVTGAVLAVASLAAALTIIGSALRSLDGMIVATVETTDSDQRLSGRPNDAAEGET
jgi:hypothetical protein